MKIISVVGARPNFMKISPLVKAIKEYNEINKNVLTHILVHTGQHYDDRMSNLFFDELNIPNPDINLNIGSGTHSEQVGKTMIAFEKILIKENPDWVVVVGDVNATIACSIAAKKLCIKVCHIESGLRSGDMSMPEEINRLVTDRLSDLLLTPDKISSENLRKEGIDENKIKFVGNIMIDTLESNREKAMGLKVNEIIDSNLMRSQNSNFNNLNIKNNILLTLHRPSNVDKKEIFEPIIDFLCNEISTEFPIIWPVHPRTRKQLIEFNLLDSLLNNKSIFLLNPLGYIDMLCLNMHSEIVITDSGGLQEECMVIGNPCLTLRWNTERPITLLENGGVSSLSGNNILNIKKHYNEIKKSNLKSKKPKFWDGNTAFRCLDALLNYSY